MDIRKNQPSKKNVVSNTLPLLGLNEGIESEIARIKKLCTKFADIAYSLGETNDPEDYAKEMEDSILTAYKKVQKKTKPNH